MWTEKKEEMKNYKKSARIDNKAANVFMQVSSEQARVTEENVSVLKYALKSVVVFQNQS